MEIVETRIHDKGQITIPVKARETLGLEKGDKLIIFVTPKEIVIRPKLKDPLKNAGFLGKEKGVKTVKELLLGYWEKEK